MLPVHPPCVETTDGNRFFQFQTVHTFKNQTFEAIAELGGHVKLYAKLALGILVVGMR